MLGADADGFCDKSSVSSNVAEPESAWMDVVGSMGETDSAPFVVGDSAVQRCIELCLTMRRTAGQGAPG